MMVYTLAPISYLYFYLAPLFHAKAISLNSFPLYVQSAASWTLLSQDIFVTDWLYNLIIKIPFILSDIGISFVVYKMASKYYSKPVALLSFILVFVNPMLIWVSAVWGMFDSIPAFFVILSTYLLLQERSSLASVSLALAVGYKLYPFLLVIPMMAYIYGKTKSFRKITIPIVSFLGTFALIFVPILRYIPLIIKGAFESNSSVSSNPSTQPALAYGLTYWSIAPLTVISGAMIQDLSILLFLGMGIATTTISVLLLRKNQDIQVLLFSQIITIGTIFLSYPRVNEQWFAWLLPSLVLLGAGNWIKERYVILISLVAMIYSWINSLFAAFFIPIAFYDEDFIRALYGLTSVLIPYRLEIMAACGLIFSAMLLWIFVDLGKRVGLVSELRKKT
jgi:Gpi18-like mannosyltransferase